MCWYFLQNCHDQNKSVLPPPRIRQFVSITSLEQDIQDITWQPLGLQYILLAVVHSYTERILLKRKKNILVWKTNKNQTFIFFANIIKTDTAADSAPPHVITTKLCYSSSCKVVVNPTQSSVEYNDTLHPALGFPKFGYLSGKD